MRSLSATVLVAFACGAALAQGGADGREDAKSHVAQAVQRLDALIIGLEASRTAARELAQVASRAAAIADVAGDVLLAEAARAIEHQQGELLQELEARLKSLREVSVRGALLAPPPVADAMAPVRERIAAAAKKWTLEEVQAELVAIESELAGGSGSDGVPPHPLLGLVRYRLADVLTQRAASEIGKERHREAEKTLVQAVGRFGEVLLTPDASEPAEGSSMHACALRRIVQVECSLYDGHKQLSLQQPNVAIHARNARRHKQAAEQAFEKLRRLFPNAVLADGRTAVEAARDDAARLAR